MIIEAMAREAGLYELPSIVRDARGLITAVKSEAFEVKLARFHALTLEQAAVICDKRAQHFAGLIEQQSCAQCLAFDIRAEKGML